MFNAAASLKICLTRETPAAVSEANVVHEHPPDLGVGDDSANDDWHRHVPDFGRDVEDELSAEQRPGGLDDNDAEVDVRVVAPQIIDRSEEWVPNIEI